MNSKVKDVISTTIVVLFITFLSLGVVYSIKKTNEMQSQKLKHQQLKDSLELELLRSQILKNKTP